MITRRPRTVGSLAALALAVRLAYVLGAAARHLPFSDALWYQSMANVLAGGHGYVQPLLYSVDGRAVPTAAHPPLYPLFLAAGSVLGAKSVLAHEVMGCVLGVITVVGAGLIAAHVAGERAGLVAMALAAIYPPMWVTDGGIMTEGLFTLLTAVIVLVSYRFAERHSVRDAAVLGVTLGLASLTRDETVLLFLVLVIPLVFMVRGVRTARRLLLLGVVAASSCLVVSPWVIRNLETFERPVILSTEDGTVLGANCPPTYYGSGIGNWYESCYDGIKTAPGADESVYNAAAVHAGLEYIRAHISRVPYVVAARVGRVWQVYQPIASADGDTDDGRPHWANIVDTFAYALMVPAAVAGTVILVRRRRRIFPLMSVLIWVTLTAALVWGAVRFRAPAEVVLVVLGAVAIDACWTRGARNAR